MINEPLLTSVFETGSKEKMENDLRETLWYAAGLYAGGDFQFQHFDQFVRAVMTISSWVDQIPDPVAVNDRIMILQGGGNPPPEDYPDVENPARAPMKQWLEEANRLYRELRRQNQEAIS